MTLIATNNYPSRMLIKTDDLLSDQAAAQLAAEKVYYAFGALSDHVPAYNGMIPVFTTNLVSVSSTASWLFVEGVLCDSQDTSTTNLPAAFANSTSGQRTDGLFVKQVTNTQNGPTRTVLNNDGTLNENYTLTQNIRQWRIQYVAGPETNNGAPPATPSGYDPYCYFTVNSSGAVIRYAQMFSTINSILATFLPTVVSGQNGVVVAQVNPAGTGSQPTGQPTAITVTGPAWTSTTGTATVTDEGVSGGAHTYSVDVPVIHNGQYVSSIVANANGTTPTTLQGSVTISGAKGVRTDVAGQNILINGPGFESLSGTIAVTGGAIVSDQQLYSFDVPVLQNGQYVNSIIADANNVTPTTLQGAITLAGANGIATEVSGNTVQLTGANPQSPHSTMSVAYASGAPSGQSYLNVDIAAGAVQGSAGISSMFYSNQILLAGSLIPYLKNCNYGNAYSTLLTGSDYIPALPSYLGACQHVSIFDGSFAGATSGNTTIESVFRVRVRAGLGAQTVGGKILASTPTWSLWRDGTSFQSQAALSTTSVAWSTTIPDDGAYHTLIFHFWYNQAFAYEIGPWLPADTSGVHGGGLSHVFDYAGL